MSEKIPQYTITPCGPESTYSKTSDERGDIIIFSSVHIIIGKDKVTVEALPGQSAVVRKVYKGPEGEADLDNFLNMHEILSEAAPYYEGPDLPGVIKVIYEPNGDECTEISFASAPEGNWVQAT